MDEQPASPSPVAAVILAAGAASRMGQPKLLLPWKGEALIRHSARTAIQAGLDPVVVVTGAASDDMQTALSGLALKLVFNPDWQAGQSTSVRIGIQSLPAQARAVIFLLGDQPYVSADLLKGLVRAYIDTQPLILAPFVAEKRANPVLFDRAVFGEMLALQGDAGARTIFAQHPPTPLPWPDERLLFDVDTPEDYQRLLG